MGDANADGYASDPRVITVAAARSDGRVTRYSNPGACVLVAGPSSEIVAGGSDIDPAFPTLFTTDLAGVAGRNQVVTLTDSADYRFDSTGFTGTSGATPVVSGVVALMLSVNPSLGYRDVQQALLLSCRHADLADPALQTNGAGLRVSYNLGYGIPDAGLAVSRAAAWKNRPKREQVTFTSTVQRSIPDDGLRVEISGPGVPSSLLSIPATAAFGAHADVATGWFPIAAVGQVLSPVATNLAGVAALCQRGVNTFLEKITRCVDAGAPVVIVYNNTGLTDRLTMLNTDFVPVPAVLIGRTAGETLDAFVRTNSSAQARILLLKTNCTFHVTNTLVCEHVWVKLQSDHPRRGDVRLTLVSPAGTRSLLQRISTDASPLPADGWTYYSVDHFFEGTAGTWTLEASDEDYAALSGKVIRVDLTLTGTPITDSDRDGLDDGWETAHFGDLSARPNEDPDGDGIPNAIEQVLGTDPHTADVKFRLDLTPWSAGIARLSWPGTEGATYRVLTSMDPAGPYNEVAIVPGRFPVTEWFNPFDTVSSHLLRVERIAP
jgi:subtilisin-like proprotein convertase family protein